MKLRGSLAWNATINVASAAIGDIVLTAGTITDGGASLTVGGAAQSDYRLTVVDNEDGTKSLRVRSAKGLILLFR